MDEQGFRLYLKRAGKKEHVVDGLARQVQALEAHLAAVGHPGLEAVGEEDLQAYVESLDPAAVKGQMRGVGLYLRFAGNEPLARLAGQIREQGIAKTRRPFKLRDFRGVDPQDVARLENIGVVTVDDMLAAGKTLPDRQQLSARTGVAPEAILELVKLSDISRVGAIKSVRARLYYDAGLDTPDKFARWEPEALRQMLVQWVEDTGFDGIAPLPKEIRNAIATARELPPMIQY